MKYFEAILRTTFADFKRNRIRTFLTSLGIMVGVLSVVMLVAIGLGLKNFISQQFEDLGANVIAIAPGQGIAGGFSSLASTTRFDEQDVRSLNKIRELDFVVPAYITNINFETDEKSDNGALIGTSEDFGTLFALELMEGRFFDKSDLSSGAKVGVIGEALSIDLFEDPEDAVGQFVRARNNRIKIVGLTKNKGVPERDSSIMVPYTMTFNTVNPRKEFFIIYTGVEDADGVVRAKREIEETFLKRYDEDDFEAVEPTDILSTLSEIFVIINGVLIAIGSISLVVGGIGIMNIMYANVTEGTKEIGVRRAVGATRRDILIQFLSESTILSLLGGLSGLAISAGIVAIARNFFPLEINLLAVVMAIGISSLIGIFFGVFPARSAANLTPIEAIRN